MWHMMIYFSLVNYMDPFSDVYWSRLFFGIISEKTLFGDEEGYFC